MKFNLNLRYLTNNIPRYILRPETKKEKKYPARLTKGIDGITENGTTTKKERTIIEYKTV